MKNWLGRKIRVKVKPVGTRTIQHSANSGINGSAALRPRPSIAWRNAHQRMTARIAGRQNQRERCRERRGIDEIETGTEAQVREFEKVIEARKKGGLIALRYSSAEDPRRATCSQGRTPEEAAAAG